MPHPLDVWLWRAYDSPRGIRLTISPGATQKVLTRLHHLHRKEIEAGYVELKCLEIRRSPVSPIDIWIVKNAQGQATPRVDPQDSPDPLLEGS